MPTASQRMSDVERRAFWADYAQRERWRGFMTPARYKSESPCKYCGGPVLVHTKRQLQNRQFCSRTCASRWRIRFCPALARAVRRHGPEHPNWRGGRSVDAGGYVRVTVGPQKKAKEHRYVMEQTLGRALTPHEFVHHRNGDKTDNRPENLELWVRAHPFGARAGEAVKHCPTCTCGEH